MALRCLLAIAIFQLAAGAAHACLFSRSVQPEQWYEWASALFAGEVTNIEQDPKASLDIITVRIVETFKGPNGDIATVRVPSRMWASCRLDRPVVGANVLVAMNSNNDTELVPLTASYAESLRVHRSKLESRGAR